ncbi:hypothetical protein Syun_022066 [Stephania yunnanensis]|uniref:Uncharacterized protein n=1 Tax=Stephania yunnanensis TaxID=152371 RepID=A0AAP0NR89_9MAGN
MQRKMPDEFLLNKAVRTISIKNKAYVDTRIVPTECLGCHYITFSVSKISKKRLFTYLLVS